VIRVRVQGWVIGVLLQCLWFAALWLSTTPLGQALPGIIGSVSPCSPTRPCGCLPALLLCCCASVGLLASFFVTFTLLVCSAASWVVHCVLQHGFGCVLVSPWCKKVQGMRFMAAAVLCCWDSSSRPEAAIAARQPASASHTVGCVFKMTHCCIAPATLAE
jgi:hypothetical protein